MAWATNMLQICIAYVVKETQAVICFVYTKLIPKIKSDVHIYQLKTYYVDCWINANWLVITDYQLRNPNADLDTPLKHVFSRVQVDVWLLTRSRLWKSLSNAAGGYLTPRRVAVRLYSLDQNKPY